MNIRFINCEVCQTEGRILTNDGGPDDVDHGVCPECNGERVIEIYVTPGDITEPEKEAIRTEHGVIKNGRYFNTGKTYWPDGTIKFDFDASNARDPWFNGTISKDGFINDYD